MSTQTKNLGLIKPGLDDKVDIGDLNQNFDAIDDLLVDATEIKKGLMSSEDKTKLNQMSPEDINKKADKTYVDNQNALLQEQVSLKADTTYVDTELNKKADTTYVDTELNKKADSTYLTAELGKKSDTTYVDAELGKKADTTYVDTELGKKTSKTYVDTALEKKTDKTYVDTELEKKADTEYVNDNFANALKGNASGSVISVDDVSPIEHSVKCKANSINEFDISKVTTSSTVSVENGKILINHKYANKVGTLKQICPNIQPNVEYFLSMKSDADVQFIYVNDGGVEWKNNTKLLITPEMLDIQVIFYGAKDRNVTIENFQIELGSVATPYTPYVDVSNTNVNVCGKNLFDFSKMGVGNGQYDAISGEFKCNINNSNYSYFLTNDTNILQKIEKGKTYTFSCKGNPSGKQLVILLRYINTDNVQKEVVKFTVGNSVTLTSPMTFKYANGLILRFNQGDTPFTDTTSIIKDFQFEENSTNTNYEPYINGGTYIPTINGTVNGIKSIAPNMTILSDTDGVNIEAEYNKDINKAFEKLTNTIISLGGNI